MSTGEKQDEPREARDNLKNPFMIAEMNADRKRLQILLAAISKVKVLLHDHNSHRGLLRWNSFA